MGTLSETLRELRAEYGFTPSEVAQLAGVDPQRIHAFEEDRTAPSLRELAALGQALAVDPADLYAGRAVPPARSVARFRAPAGISELPGHDARLLARAAEAGRMGAELARLAGRALPLVERRVVKGIAMRPAPWRQGYALGEAARLPSGDAGPIPSVQAWLESVGVHVAFAAFASADIEAASVFEPGSMPVVLLNEQAERVRNKLSRRAILAHELCHLLHDGGERELTIVSRDQDVSPVEQRANGFAPSFLAPGPWVEVEGHGAATLVAGLARRWGLTFQGASWHAKNLKLIAPEEAEQLSRVRRRIDAPAFEAPRQRLRPDSVGLDTEASALASGLLSDLALKACLDGAISIGRAREILSFR